MKPKSFVWPALATTILLLLLQLVPVYIPAKLLFFNNRFILGEFQANNLALIALVAFSYLPIVILSKSSSRWPRIASIVLLASILSNLLDRIFRGGATDYISIGNWPTFNIADVLIIAGIAIIGYNYLFGKN